MVTATRSKRKSKKKFDKNAVYKVFTDTLIADMERCIETGDIPSWKKSWTASSSNPMAVTGRNTTREYTGFNVFWMNLFGAISGYSDPRWITVKKVKELGGEIKQEELGKTTPVAFYKQLRRKPDPNKEYTDEELENLGDFWLLRYYRVYNVEQCENLEIGELDVSEPRNDMNPIQEAEAIVRGMPNKPEIRHGGNKAFYMPSVDRVTVPEIKTFDSMEEYYSTLFHELGHSTAHESRLDREGIRKFSHFGDDLYSKEELVAEFTASILSNTIGMTQTIENSKAYLLHWIKVLKNDPKLLVRGATQAHKATSYILGGE